MTDLRRLMDSLNKFAGEPEQKPGDQVRGTDNPKKSGKKHGFHGRLVGEGMDEFASQLLKEYHMFVEQPALQGNTQADNPTSPVANINPPGQGTAATQANTQAQTTAVAGQPQQTQTPGQPQQPQNATQTQAQQAAQNLKTKQDLTTNLSSLKTTVDPNMNIQKTVQALQKDPTKLTPADAQALGKITRDIVPALQDKAAMGQLKSNVERLVK